MIDLKLIDTIQTFCIGIFVLVLIIFFYFLFNKYFVKERFDEQRFLTWINDDILKGESTTGYISLAVILIYFLGIISSDLTERMTDSNNDKERSGILKELHKVSFMPSVGEMRRLSLIGSDDSLTTLGTSVFRSLPLVKGANEINESHFFLAEGDSSLAEEDMNSLVKKYLKDKKFDRFISLLYYASKNWVFSKDHEPLQELKSIQNRVDLSRSIVLITAVAVQLLLLFYIVYFILNTRKITGYFKKNDTVCGSKFKSAGILFFNSLLIFLVIAILCRECFKTCLLSYNKRAYGYYVSHLTEKQTSSDIQILTVKGNSK